jgi:hypothetical protein
MNQNRRRTHEFWKLLVSTHHTSSETSTTMVFSAAANAARRQIAVMAAHQKTSAHQTQRRAMASGPAPEWQGIDKVVRGVFPHDHQRTFFFEIPYSLHFWSSLNVLYFSFPFSRHGHNGWIFCSVCAIQNHECH